MCPCMLYVHESMLVRVPLHPAYLCKGQNGGPVPPSITLHLIALKQSVTKREALHFWLGWLTASSCLHSSVLGLQACTTMFDFFTWGLWVATQVHMFAEQNLLPTEPLP